jgi:prolyl oligopeptidase
MPVVQRAPTDLAPRSNVVEELHGVSVSDPFRNLEDTQDPAVQAWVEQRNERFDVYTGALAQRDWLSARFQQLWRYDDESLPSLCHDGDRQLKSTKRADQDKWVTHLRENEDSVWRVVMDPNTWESTQTLAGFSTSHDCTMVAYGVANAGDENPQLYIMDLDTLEVHDDTFQGWKQGGVNWLPDGSGFYYSSKPLEGEVEEGGHYYWHRTWFHALGNQADADTLAFSDTEVKEHYNSVGVSEDGAWLTLHRGMFNKSELWIQSTKADSLPVEMVTGMDAEYSSFIVDDSIYIHTDWEAPNYRLMTTTVDKPQREYWTEVVAESKHKLSYVRPIQGHLYATYGVNAATQISVLDMQGQRLHEIPLPSVGSAGVSGLRHKGDVRVSFSSFANPSTTYTYDVSTNTLTLAKASPLDIDTTGMMSEQVWYPSKDGTMVSMFVVRNIDAPRDGTVPTLLTGYGGFNISMRPRFSTLYAAWLEAGGAVAIPNLRGGGEYGVAWHEAGMRDQKQNVFDDFISAAEYLIAEGYTSSDRLAISGGSNGGLLVSAAVTQAPELFKAVLCAVPLTDMIRFHHFGIANIWSEEYGNADDPEMFPHILAYSPYHNVEVGVDYPAILVTGSANDARTDPIHAMKFAAAVRAADRDLGSEEPILLHIQADSGHGGGVTIDTRADQSGRHYGFLMEQIGLSAPAE